MMKKRFPITDYLEVVLTEDDKTAIYINGQHFIQCSHVLTTVHTDEIENIILLESVDDIKEAPETIVIDPETRYFVHCSNLQAWVENKFDSRMLHSNLSFPLLKKLVEEGCVSNIVLKEEIAKRFENGSAEMINFLLEYLNILSKEDLVDIITLNLPENITPKCLKMFYEKDLIDKDVFKQQLAKIFESSTSWVMDDACHIATEWLTNEERINMIPGRFQVIKDIVNKLEIEFHLWALNNPITYHERGTSMLLLSIVNDNTIRIGIQHYPDLQKCFIWILSMLEKMGPKYEIELELWENDCRTIPDNIPLTYSIVKLQIAYCSMLESLPSSIENLQSLRELRLYDTNNLNALPETIGNLQSLQVLELYTNNLSTLPESIGNLQSLRELRIKYTKITTLPSSIENLKLKSLELPNSFLELKFKILKKSKKIDF